MSKPTTKELRMKHLKFQGLSDNEITIITNRLEAAEKESKQDAEVILRIGNQLEAAELLITTLYDSGCLDIEREELVRKHIYGASHE